MTPNEKVAIVLLMISTIMNSIGIMLCCWRKREKSNLAHVLMEIDGKWVDMGEWTPEQCNAFGTLYRKVYQRELETRPAVKEGEEQ